MLALLSLLLFAPEPEPIPVEHLPGTGAVSGVVSDTGLDAALEGATVTLRCDCLDQPRTVQTNGRGIYAFGELPAGRYELRAEVGPVSSTREFELPERAKYRANFGLNLIGAPMSEEISTEPDRPRDGSAVVDISEAKSLPVSPLAMGYFVYPWPWPTELERAEAYDWTFGLERSLFNDAGAAEFLGVPQIEQHL